MEVTDSLLQRGGYFEPDAANCGPSSVSHVEDPSDHQKQQDAHKQLHVDLFPDLPATIVAKNSKNRENL